jgi:putative endonuclease
MAFHNDLGKEGESIAAAYLIKKGYKIIATNWRHRQEEIDIIAIDGKELVIIEVKTRTSSFFETPEMAVTRSKQKFLIHAAAAYIRRFQMDHETRFDILSIIKNINYQEVKHIENAFYPGI